MRSEKSIEANILHAMIAGDRDTAESLVRRELSWSERDAFVRNMQDTIELVAAIQRELGEE